MRKIFMVMAVVLVSAAMFTSCKPEPEPESILLPYQFSVSESKRVQFTNGNLYWDGSSFKVEANQLDYPTEWDSNHIGHFYWTKTAEVAYAETYNDGTCTTSDKFFADGSDADHILTIEGQTDLYVLSRNEWNYLLVCRPNASNLYKFCVQVDNDSCVIIAPDNFTDSLKAQYTLEEVKEYGLLCLPAAGERRGSGLSYTHSFASYWSSTPSYDDDSAELFITPIDGWSLFINNIYRYDACAIRLVHTVE